MTRKPAAPANLRNGLKWRDGRPRWEPSPANRACGFSGMDLRDHEGRWMERGAATTAADARTLWARLVREAMRDDAEGSRARGMLAAALERVAPARPEPEHQHSRALVSDLIERGRAVLEAREPELTAAGYAPRTVAAMVEGYFADAHAMRRISRGTQEVYQVQGRKLKARFGSLRVDEVTRPKINAWYRDLQSTVSTATANVAVGAAGAMFKWAALQDPPWLAINPCTGLERDTAAGRLVFWTWEEETAFVAWCDANGFADVADCVTVGLWTGARQVDIAAATVADLGGEVWRYTPIKTQRKNQEAVAGLLDPVKTRLARRTRDLADHPRINPEAAPFLWDARMNRRHTSDSIGYRFKEARADALRAKAVPATVAGKKLQDTRDTCVTRLWAAGVSPSRIGTWGGWASNSVERILRQHYLSLLDDGAIETANQLRDYAERCGVTVAA